MTYAIAQDLELLFLPVVFYLPINSAYVYAIRLLNIV